MGSARKAIAGVAVLLLLAAGCGKIAEKATEKGIKKATGISVKGDGTVPDGFPSELAPPKGSKIYYSVKTAAGGRTSFAVQASYDGDAASVSAGLKKQLADANYEISSDSLSNGSGGAGGSLAAMNDKWRVNANFGDNSYNNDDNGVYVILSVTELTADETTTASTEGSGPTTTEATQDSTTTTGSSGSGSSGDLPEGFPSELAPPDNATIISGTKYQTGGKTSYVLSVGLVDEVPAVYKALKKVLTDYGFTLVVDQLTTAGGQSYGTFSGTSPKYTVTATIAPNTTGEGGYVTVASFNLAET